MKVEILRRREAIARNVIERRRRRHLPDRTGGRAKLDSMDDGVCRGRTSMLGRLSHMIGGGRSSRRAAAGRKYAAAADNDNGGGSSDGDEGSSDEDGIGEKDGDADATAPAKTGSKIASSWRASRKKKKVGGWKSSGAGGRAGLSALKPKAVPRRSSFFQRVLGGGGSKTAG